VKAVGSGRLTITTNPVTSAVTGSGLARAAPQRGRVASKTLGCIGATGCGGQQPVHDHAAGGLDRDRQVVGAALQGRFAQVALTTSSVVSRIVGSAVGDRNPPS
jgi:hypothetical protein